MTPSGRSTLRREDQIIELAAEGLTDKQIAQRLEISAETVATYWKRILARHGASSRTEVVARIYKQLQEENRHLLNQARETSARLHTLMDHMESAVLFETPDRHIVFVNESFCNMFAQGARPQDMVGQDCAAAAEASIDAFAEGEKFLSVTDECIRGGKPVLGQLVAMTDGRVLERDYRPVEADGVSTGHLWVYRDVTERRRIEASLKLQVAQQRQIVSIVPDVLKAEAGTRDETIQRILETVGAAQRTDRAYLFLFDEDGLTMSNTHEWCAEGISSEKDNLQGLEVEEFPWWMEQLRANHPLVVPDVAKLPKEAAAIRENLAAQGIKSLLVMPVRDGDTLVGFAGFDSVREYRSWSKSTFAMVKVTAEMIAATLARS